MLTTDYLPTPKLCHPVSVAGRRNSKSDPIHAAGVLTRGRMQPLNPRPDVEHSLLQRKLSIPGGSRKSTDCSQYIFKKILVPSESQRKAAVEALLCFLKGYLATNEDDKLRDRTAGESIVGYETLADPASRRALLQSHIPTIARLADESPFADIRVSFTELLEHCKSVGLQIPLPARGPSKFISSAESVPVEPTSPRLQALFQHMFLQAGLVSHVDRVMAYLPEAFESHWMTLNYVTREPGPLPLPWRNYIAIMAASRHNCKYLVKRQESEFLINNGDAAWLLGLDHVPKKLANLAEMNAILAHQPWRLTKLHVEALVRGKDAWSIAELVHATVLMCTFHSLCGFVMGTGVTPEVDLRQSNDPVDDFDVDNSPSSPPLVGVAETGASADTAEVIRILKAGLSDVANGEDARAGILATNLGSSPGSPSVMDKSSQQQPKTSVVASAEYCAKYIASHKMQHVDFDIKSREYQGLRTQDYCWKAHGYPLVNRFYPGIAPLLDREFSSIYDLTDNSFANTKNIETAPFRRATWYYVNLIMGVTNDDYDYHQVNVVLNRAVKRYMKKVVCFPEHMSQHDFVNFGYTMPPWEKVHVTLLATEARKEACILYGLAAVLKRMSD